MKTKTNDSEHNFLQAILQYWRASIMYMSKSGVGPVNDPFQYSSNKQLIVFRVIYLPITMITGSVRVLVNSDFNGKGLLLSFTLQESCE